MRGASPLSALLALLAAGGQAQAQSSPAALPSSPPPDSVVLADAARQAEQQLHQTFTNLHFEDFGPAPVTGPLYQASAGGKIIYYAPQSDHILFATVYDRNGVNVTALAESARAQKQLSAVDPAKALALGPPDAPTVIEFTDPECPYCQALERYWVTRAAEGKPVRRLVYFVSGIHPQAAAKAEHILCSPAPAATFKALYAGSSPPSLLTCPKGHEKVQADAALVARIGVSGTPTLILDGKIVSGFQQGEIEAFLNAHAGAATRPAAAPSVVPAHASAPAPAPALPAPSRER